MNKIESNEVYSKKLAFIGYNREDIDRVLKKREELEFCPTDMFEELVKQGAVIRTRKLKNNRNIFTDGKLFYYLEHYKRDYNYCGFFTKENE